MQKMWVFLEKMKNMTKMIEKTKMFRIIEFEMISDQN